MMGTTQSNSASADALSAGQLHQSSDEIPYTSYSVERNAIRGECFNVSQDGALVKLVSYFAYSFHNRHTYTQGGKQ